jgi:two-component system response regulator AtoC
MRILIVDDDATTLMFFEQALVEDGYDVCAVETVEAGLAEAAKQSPDAVVLDLHMPISDGLACLRRLRAAPLNLTMPVAIVTGDYFLDEGMARDLQTLGARIQFKPMWEDDLRRLIGTLVHQRAGQLS